MKVEVAVPNKPYGFCGRKATLNRQDSNCHGLVIGKAQVHGDETPAVTVHD